MDLSPYNPIFVAKSLVKCEKKAVHLITNEINCVQLFGVGITSSRRAREKGAWLMQQ